MTYKTSIAATALIALGLTGFTSAQAARPVADAAVVSPAPADAELAETRRAVSGVHADAMAILAAVRRDPTLTDQLAKNPAGAEALLRANGATRAEHIVVEPSPTGERITITIVIGPVTIIIVIKK